MTDVSEKNLQSEKETVALNSIYASGAMTVAKFTVGLMTGSLGLLSEGLHSLLDLGATAMTYMAVRVSDKPADDKHHYGHGKIESVTALAETGLLFITSIWIVYEAVKRLVANDHSVEFTWWGVVVIGGSIVIDFFRARALSRVAKATNSQALEADALHFQSDILSSSVVLLGLIFVAIGWPQGDSIASLGVAIFVCKAGWDLGRRTIDTLIDAAPEGVADTVTRVATGIPSIIAVNRVRARPAGSVMFVEVDIAISRGLSLDHVHAIKNQFATRIIEEIPEAELSMTTTAIALDNETIHQRVGIIAANMHLPIHHVTVHQVDGKISISLDMEVDGEKSLGEAHDLATALEEAICNEIGDDIEVETHIEPLQIEELAGADVAPATLNEIIHTIEGLAKDFTALTNIHDVRVRQTRAGMIMIFHSWVDPVLSVAAVHETIDALERRIREQYPETHRVIGHAEPRNT